MKEYKKQYNLETNIPYIIFLKIVMVWSFFNEGYTYNKRNAVKVRWADFWDGELSYEARLSPLGLYFPGFKQMIPLKWWFSKLSCIEPEVAVAK